jgi:hypothetical protein
MLYRRIKISWQDMQGLLWPVKTMMKNITDGSTAPKFDKIPKSFSTAP